MCRFPSRLILGALAALWFTTAGVRGAEMRLFNFSREKVRVVTLVFTAGYKAEAPPGLAVEGDEFPGVWTCEGYWVIDPGKFLSVNPGDAGHLFVRMTADTSGKILELTDTKPIAY